MNATLPHYARSVLAQFLFRNISVEKKVSQLSGGERLRALLACLLNPEHPCDLLILDEPTNNMDLASVEAIEQGLNQYGGAMLVVSHDKDFLENIGIEKHIQM